MVGNDRTVEERQEPQKVENDYEDKGACHYLATPLNPFWQFGIYKHSYAINEGQDDERFESNCIEGEHGSFLKEEPG